MLLHGFTGSSETLSETAAALHDEFCVLRVDLPGHGKSDSPENPSAYTMERCALLLRGLLDEFRIERTNLFGYSMGGRAALSFTALHPERVCAVAALGASAGLENEEERAARQKEDDELAQRILDHGLKAFVDSWMRHPVFNLQKNLGEEFLDGARNQRMQNDRKGLAHSLRGMGAGAQPPVHDLLARLELPILLLAGVRDEKFCSIAVDLADRLRNASVELIPGAGHAAHVECSDATHAAIRDFFRKVTGLSNTKN
jgi:2-succinyl-6-hydroxy-2,4-cyclohexadiene-1-carboxylate synthase